MKKCLSFMLISCFLSTAVQGQTNQVIPVIAKIRIINKYQTSDGRLETQTSLSNYWRDSSGNVLQINELMAPESPATVVHTTRTLQTPDGIMYILDPEQKKAVRKSIPYPLKLSVTRYSPDLERVIYRGRRCVVVPTETPPSVVAAEALQDEESDFPMYSFSERVDADGNRFINVWETYEIAVGVEPDPQNFQIPPDYEVSEVGQPSAGKTGKRP